MSQHAPSIENYDQYRTAVKQMDQGKKPAFLREDPRLMGFIFVHDSQDKGKRYEGVTFSFGRVASRQTQNRDIDS